MDDHGTRLLCSASSATYLKNKLAQTFQGSKIRQIKRRINIQHRYQGDFREVMALGEQLGADQNGGHAFVNFFDKIRHRALPPCRVSIDS